MVAVPLIIIVQKKYIYFCMRLFSTIYFYISGNLNSHTPRHFKFIVFRSLQINHTKEKIFLLLTNFTQKRHFYYMIHASLLLICELFSFLFVFIFKSLDLACPIYTNKNVVKMMNWYHDTHTVRF